MRQISEEEKQILEQMPDNVSGVKTNAETNNQQTQQVQQTDEEKLSDMIGKRVGYKETDEKRENQLQAEAAANGLYIGANIYQRAEMAEGWQVVDRRLLKERDVFYPANWQFRIKPATVEAIRNWSTIDNTNNNVIDDVFNEVIKSCLSIVTPAGLIPWGNIRSWDRFYFLLLIRQYTFITGENKIEYTDDCAECDNPVTFELNSTTLEYDIPDEDIMKYYDQMECNWKIDPVEYDLDGDVITLYLPTLEKDANIKAWMIDKIQNKKKVDPVFIKFLPWMAKSISKNLDVAKRQIKELETKFKSYDKDMFLFLNDVINNIIVNPRLTITKKCPTCGEDVTARFQFPNGVSELFNDKSRKGKKFGSR